MYVFIYVYVVCKNFFVLYCTYSSKYLVQNIFIKYLLVSNWTVTNDQQLRIEYLAGGTYVRRVICRKYNSRGVRNWLPPRTTVIRYVGVLLFFWAYDLYVGYDFAAKKPLTLQVIKISYPTYEFHTVPVGTIFIGVYDFFSRKWKIIFSIFSKNCTPEKKKSYPGVRFSGVRFS